MSAYPQPHPHHMGASLYPQPQFAMPTYGYSQPAYNAPMDPNTFRQYYATQLATLTVNSRPIIQQLSTLAQEYSRMGHIVAQCLESHIRLAQPQTKLPALYLLDAIAKNVPVPYTSVLADPVVGIFIEAYESVDPQTQVKMEEMLSTWRNGGPGGRELFGIVTQRKLESFVNAKYNSRQPVASQVAPRKVITKGHVLTEINVLVAQKENTLAQAYDNTTAKHLATLRQLHQVVRSSDLSQEDLNSIITQLRSLNQPVALNPPVFPTSVPGVPVNHPVSGVPTANAASIPPELKAFLGLMAPAPVSQNLQVPPAHLSSKPVDLASIRSSLIKAGVLPASGVPAKDDVSSNPPDPEKAAFNQYEREVLSLRILPTSADMARQLPRFMPYVYGRLTLQCKQCAVRFPNSAVGKQKMNDHLDSHFRQNSAQMSGRGHSRSWFLGSQHWLKDRNGKGKGREEPNPAAAALEKEAKLRDSFVVVPAGDEAKTITCPICREPVQPEFKEDEEEWVYRNAISTRGKIYHATCHADASSGANSLIAKLIIQNGLRSRSATPEVRTERPATPLNSSVKRKASGMDGPSLSEEELEGTPPLKRVALSIP